VTYEAVKQEIAGREHQGELIGILREQRMPEVTTRRMLDLERRNIREVLDGRGKQEPIIKGEEVGGVIDGISSKQRITLNNSQREAVEQLLTSRDRIFGLQGLAGTGKTTVLSVLRAAAEETGYEVRGFAPSTPAAKALSDSGIETTTLQKFTFSKRQTSEEGGKRLYVLDESSLASTSHIHKFFDRIAPDDRIWLVGDKGQHQSVEAGSPFGQFQAHGMGAAKVAEIVRQKNELKQVVEKFAERKVKDAVRDLIAQGRVLEFADDITRLKAMAADYCARREETLVISPANEERVVFNGMVHRELQKAGAVTREDHRMRVLVNRADMTKTERTFAGAYNPGEVIRYNHNSEVYGTRVGDYGRVVSRNREENTLRVKLMKDNREITYDPRRLSGVSVYVEAERDFSVGDLIQFRAPLGEKRVANGEFGTIREITKRGCKVEWKVELLRDKRRVAFDPRVFRHIDHGYAVTSYSAQCATFPRVLINADTKESALLLNQRTGYVGISRAELDARIYTDSLQKLGEALDRRVDKEMALEAVAQNRLRPKAEAKTAGDERGKAAKSSRSQERTAAQNVAGNDAATNGLRPDGSATFARSEASLRPRTFKRAAKKYDFPEWEKPAQQKLVRVRRKDPCPICNRPNWCSVSADRAIAICMRVPSEYETKNGGFVHVLDPTIQNQQPIPVTVEVAQYKRAEIDRRHKVNQELLGALKLNSRDRKNLLARGLDEATIEKHEYRSVPTPGALDEVMKHFKEQDLRGIPGFFRQGERWRLNIGQWTSKKDGRQHSYHQGFLIPVRDLRGRIEGFQVRRAEIRDGDGPRYIWLSSSSKEHGSSSGAPVHFRHVEQARRSGQAIITEGALKADVAAHLLGNKHAMIAVAGVNSFPDDFGKLLRAQIPELRQIIIAFDADAGRKVEVQQALGRLRETLREAGLDLHELKWDERQGKGLDDYLIKGVAHRTEVKAFLDHGLRQDEYLFGRNHSQRQSGFSIGI
jgi:ATP-dependent exoDNAse (exonuclease V) alpha subunit